ncbi:MAG: hypothetical protein IPN68_13925 [Bacteroidetes bacterium]|nr:hypothetical protein [Bacteroidota bacterium]
MNELILLPGDVFLTRGNGFIPAAIRFFSRGFGEKRTIVNHVGMIVEKGTLQDCVAIEVSYKVWKRKLWEDYGPPAKSSVAVYRPKNLSAPELEIIVSTAEEQVDKIYGFLKILAHILDWMFFGVYFFRRLFRNNKYPICSWLVAHAFSKAGKDFGVDPGAAQPDDIWDFIQNNPEKYDLVYPLGSLWEKAGD